MNNNFRIWCGQMCFLVASSMFFAVIACTILIMISLPTDQWYFRGCTKVLAVAVAFVWAGCILTLPATPSPKPKTAQEVAEVQAKYRLDLLMKKFFGMGIMHEKDGGFSLSICATDQETADKFRELFKDNIEGVPLVFLVREIPVAGSDDKEA